MAIEEVVTQAITFRVSVVMFSNQGPSVMMPESTGTNQRTLDVSQRRTLELRPTEVIINVCEALPLLIPSAPAAYGGGGSCL